MSSAKDRRSGEGDGEQHARRRKAQECVGVCVLRFSEGYSQRGAQTDKETKINL